MPAKRLRQKRPPPFFAGKSASTGRITRWTETVEQSSRIVYLLLTFAVSTDPLRRKSVWLALPAVFLVLYYIVWLRCSIGGRNVTLPGRTVWRPFAARWCASGGD